LIKGNTMLEKLEAIKQRWENVEAEISSPDAMSDMKRFAKLNKEYKELTKVVDEYRIYSNIMSNIDANKEILATEKDEEFREMAKAELDELITRRDEKEEEIRLMLIPKDPEDSKNAIVVVPVVTKRHCLPATCTACICVTVKNGVGVLS
jgi:peptide chain release factor 1